MLAVPALVGTVRGGPAPIHATLLVAWLLGYLAFAAAGTMLHGGRRAVRASLVPLVTYGSAALGLGAWLLLRRPDLALWAPVFVPLVLVSLGCSLRRADRSLLNDAVTILAACLFAGVAFQAGTSAPAGDGTGWAVWSHVDLWRSADGAVMAWVIVALFAYFFGTALYVKTVIRERTNPSYHRASVAYHAAWTVAWALSGSVGVPMSTGTRVGFTALFAVLTSRAAVLAGRSVRPLFVGLGEIAASAAMLVLTLTW